MKSYNNVKRKRSWSKAGLMVRKVGLCRTNKESCTMSCSLLAKYFSLTCTVSNWNIWRAKSPSSTQPWPTGREWCSIRTMPSPAIHYRQKLRELDWEVFNHLIVRSSYSCLPFVSTNDEWFGWWRIDLKGSLWESIVPIEPRVSQREAYWYYSQNNKKFSSKIVHISYKYYYGK